MKNIAISILDTINKDEFLSEVIKYNEKIKKISKDAFDIIIHFDVMDNKFVPNIGVELEYIKLAKKLGLYADVHLMVEKPIEEEYIKKAISYGADRISIHYEIDNFENVLEYLNTFNIDIGIVLKPNTSVEVIQKYKGKFSNLLIMSVEPGFGGQKYIENVNDKFITAKDKIKNIKFQVDGGVNFQTIVKPLEIGVDSFVIGSYLTKAENIYDNLLKLNILKDIVLEERNENLGFSKRTLQIVDNGYGKEDILLGVRTPNMRKIAKKWYKHISLDILQEFISSNIHEFRQFAIFVLTYMLNKDNKKQMYDFVNKNIKYINNWDLTDIAGPNIFAKYLILQDDNKSKKEILEYMKSSKLWAKRIGIVILLEYARKGKIDFVLECLSNVLYEEFHLYQKATGWVLREAYKKESEKVYEYLIQNNKKKRLPRILLSYACEKMSKEEKESIRSVN